MFEVSPSARHAGDSSRHENDSQDREYDDVEHDSGHDNRGTANVAEERHPCDQTKPEEFGSVPPEESVMSRFIERRYGVTKYLKRSPTALGMGIVGREHEQLGPALLEQPSSVLERERRETYLSAQILRRQ